MWRWRQGKILGDLLTAKVPTAAKRDNITEPSHSDWPKI